MLILPFQQVNHPEFHVLVAEAHSFTQQARLAITLAWVAGYTNIITIFTCGTVTSHVSGTTSNLGRDVVEGRWLAAAYGVYLLSSFFVGSALSGLCTETGRRRGWESIYVIPMALQAFFLAIFALGLEGHGWDVKDALPSLVFLTGVASIAMGLQNATITRISEGVVRTTHVTGVLTDLGLEFSHFVYSLWDRRRTLTPRKLRKILSDMHRDTSIRRLLLLLSILGSFAFGAALGTVMHDYFIRWAMVPPVLFLLWIIFQDISVPIAEIHPSQVASADAGFDLPPGIAVYHLKGVVRRGKKILRIPNLIAWSERLPKDTSVIVLDVEVENAFNHNALIELKALLHRLKSQGRHLVLAGLNQRHYEQLRTAWGAEFNLVEVAPSLDMALAHAIILLDTFKNFSKGHTH